MLSSRAMVLGKFRELSYSASLYYSCQAYGLTYFPLFVDTPAAWNDENNRWLASLFGLSYERVMAAESTYIEEIWKYLRQGVPVFTCRSWFGVSEGGGKITTCDQSIFWWEGMSRQARTRIHYVTIVGMDRSARVLYINDPIYCWNGRKGKYTPVDIDWFSNLAGQPSKRHRYVIKVFKKTGGPQKSEQEIQKLVQERIVRKLKGDPSVYDSPETWRSYLGIENTPRVDYGLDGLKSLRDSLEPDNFTKLLKRISKARGMRPVDHLTYFNLMLYHRSMLIEVTSEFLEANNKIEEWEWLLELHILYKKLWLSTTKLCSIFRSSSQGLDQAVDSSNPILEEMRGTIDRIIGHIQSYLKSHS